MVKTVALLTSVLLFSSLAHADYQLELGAGINNAQTKLDIADNVTPATSSDWKVGGHLHAGVQRPISAHSSWGMGLDLDSANGKTLVSFNALDYRYKLSDQFTLGAFLGGSRLQDGIPAWGYSGGFYGRWNDALAGADLELKYRHARQVARDKLLPGDPQNTVTQEIFRTVSVVSVSLVWPF